MELYDINTINQYAFCCYVGFNVIIRGLPFITAQGGHEKIITPLCDFAPPPKNDVDFSRPLPPKDTEDSRPPPDLQVCFIKCTKIYNFIS